MGQITIRDMDPEVEKAIRDLSKKTGNYLLSSYQELQSGKSLEGKLVKEADRLETILQMNDYIQRGYPKELFEEFKRNFSEEVDDYKNENVKNIAKKLLEGTK